MKKAFRIFLLVIAIILVLNILVVAILSNKYVQGRLLSYGESWLKEKTKTELSIGYVGFDLLNGLFVEDLYVEDLNGDTLLSAGKLKADFNFHALLNLNDLKINRVELDDFVAHIDKESDSSDFNFNFLIDAFSSDEPQTQDDSGEPFGLTIDDIVLANGWLTYDVWSSPETVDTFNASHISCRDLRLDAFFSLSPEGVISAEVKDFSFREKSGFRLENLETEATLVGDSLSVPSLVLSLPKSRLSLKAECALDDLRYNLSLGSDSLSLADVRCFVPMFASLTDSASLSLSASGKFPSVSVRDLRVDYPSFFRLEAPAVEMENCLAWDSSSYLLRVTALSVTNGAAEKIASLVDSVDSGMLAAYLPLDLSLQFDGALPDGKLECGLSSAYGSLHLDGALRYLNERRYLECDVATELKGIALDSILKSGDLGRLSMFVDAKVDWNMDSLPDVDLSARVADFSYKKYSYDTLRLSAHYFPSDSLSSHVDVKDPNVDGDVRFSAADLSDTVPRFDVAACVRHFSPKATHLADSLGNAVVDVSLSAHVDDLNSFLGEVSIDSLNLRSDSVHIVWRSPSKARHVARPDGSRCLTFASPALDADMEGAYDFNDIYPAFMIVARSFWPDLFIGKEIPPYKSDVDLSFRLKVKDVEDLMRFFGQDVSLVQGASLVGSVSTLDSMLSVDLVVPSLRVGEKTLLDIALKAHGDDGNLLLDADLVADSSASNGAAMLDLALRSTIGHNQMDGKLSLASKPDTSMLKGALPFSVRSMKSEVGDRFDMSLSIQKSDWSLMGYRFGFSPAEVRQMGERIHVKNIGISLDDNLLMDVSGVVSDQLSDTLSVRFDQVDLEPILSAFALKRIPLQCSLNGDIHAAAVTGDKVRFQTNDLRFDSLVYDGIPLGDLAVDMKWDNEHKGVVSRVVLHDGDRRVFNMQGVVKPAENMLKLIITLDSLPLDMMMPFASDYLSDTRGYLGASILAEGDIANPELDGFAYLRDAHMRINYTGVGYSISDSIKFKKNRLVVDHFILKDDNGNKLLLKGDIAHDKFQQFKYRLSINMDNFLLLNNPKAKTNMVYGVFYANAKNLDLRGNDSHLKVTGEFSNGDKTSLNIVLPETVTEVQTYDNIVYVKPDSEAQEDSAVAESAEIPFDVDADISVGLTDQASFFVNLADGAMINGHGNLRVTYREGNLSIYERFTVNNGYVKIKVSEIPSKKFTIQQGAYVDFNGDPMKLRFDATASYELTADLATLSSSFSNMGLGSTRQPVRCDAHASGTLSDMNLTYDITLPKADDNVKQNFSSIITTDDIRIREFAYLIGLGMFYAPDEQAQGDMLTSLASSSLSAALNNALSSVLGDKVSIGTGFSSSQEGFSDMEMNVSVSTKLFNDRLLLSTNLGYQKQATDADNESSFLGDFDAEYMLGKKKVVRVKAYNHTNNDFYHTSSNTQGVGVVFVKESKTLRGLLPFGKDSLGNNLLAPRDTVPVRERRDGDE